MIDGSERQDGKRDDGASYARIVVLSILLHVFLAVALWRLADLREPPATADNEPIWVDWSQPVPPSGRVVASSRQANNQPPPRATHRARRSNTVPKETRRADAPANRFGGPPSRGGGPRSDSTHQTPRQPAPPDAMPHPYDRLPSVTATDLLNQSSYGDFVTSSVSQGSYNPPGAEPGSAVWLNTHEFKYVDYFMHMKERIESAWHRTRPPYDREYSGVLQMTVLGDGKLANASLMQSCGNRELDLAVLQAIRIAAPFNPLPRVWGQDELTVNFGFHYLISQRASIF